MNLIIHLLNDPGQENVCSKYPVVNPFLNFKHMSGLCEADQSIKSLWKL